jgi:hypothetical protein
MGTEFVLEDATVLGVGRGVCTTKNALNITEVPTTLFIANMVNFMLYIYITYIYTYIYIIYTCIYTTYIFYVCIYTHKYILCIHKNVHSILYMYSINNHSKNFCK